MLIDADTGEILGLDVDKYGRGYVSEFPPTFEIQGKGSGEGAVIKGEIGASLFAPCPFPQDSRGVDGFPDQAESAANCVPEPECSAGSAFPLPATFPLKILEYYFGQFWRYEDRAESLAVPGIKISDTDLYEGCPYSRPYCSTMDVTARAQKGTILLNRRQNIAIYKEVRNTLAWSSTEENANLALKVLLYQTELPSLLGPTSTVLNFNSQVQGGTDEFLVVSAQDQGFTGFDGVSACFKGEDHTGLGFGKELSCGLRLNITIVAVNDAPVILTPDGTMIEADENVPMMLSVLDVSDSDIDEKTTSLLAIDDWTGLKQNEVYLNRIRVRLQVTKGHILLSPTARDITVTGNSTQMWWVLSRNILGHDLCRAQKCILKPSTCFPGYDPASDSQAGASYQEVCSLFETTPELIPFGISSCTDANRMGCTCQVDNQCNNDGNIFLFLNRTQAKTEEYIDELFKALSTHDATCGGLPHYGKDLAFQFSYGKPCTVDADCIPPKLQGCTPGVDCFCCGNVSQICSADSDCFGYAPAYQCGCQKSEPTVPAISLVAPCGNGEGQKPCYCCNDMTVMCNSHDHCGADAVGKDLANVSYCGCRPDEGICGPFGQGPIRAFGHSVPYYGDASLNLGSQRSLLSG